MTSLTCLLHYESAILFRRCRFSVSHVLLVLPSLLIFDLLIILSSSHYFFSSPFHSCYFYILHNVPQIPSSILKIYDKVEEFRKHIGILDLIVDSYNEAQVMLGTIGARKGHLNRYLSGQRHRQCSLLSI